MHARLFTSLVFGLTLTPALVWAAVDSDIPGDAGCITVVNVPKPIRRCKQGTPGVISFLGEAGTSTIPPGANSGTLGNPWRINSATSGTDLVAKFTLTATDADDLRNGPLGGSFVDSPYVAGRWILESIKNTSVFTWTSFRIGLNSVPHLAAIDIDGLSFGRMRGSNGKADPNNFFGQSSVQSNLLPTVTYDTSFDLLTFSGGQVKPGETVTLQFFVSDNQGNRDGNNNNNPIHLVHRPQTAATPHKAGVIRNGLWILDANGNNLWDGPATDRNFFWGQFGDTPVIGDWSGAGKDYVGVVRLDGFWILDSNGNGVYDGPQKDKVFSWGQTGDIAIVGDWNGSGTVKAGVVRPGQYGLQWILDYNGNGLWDGPDTDRVYFFGSNSDTPIVGDWSGDGKIKIGLIRPGSFGLQWILDYNGNGQWDGPTPDRAWFFGSNADTPITGDWSGDGKTKIGLVRPGSLSLQWILDFDGNGRWDGPVLDRAWFFGSSKDTPVIGDWSGSGTAKIGIYRAGLWVLDFNGNGNWDGDKVDRPFYWGQPSDLPIVGRW